MPLLPLSPPCSLGTLHFLFLENSSKFRAAQISLAYKNGTTQPDFIT